MPADFSGGCRRSSPEARLWPHGSLGDAKHRPKTALARLLTMRRDRACDIFGTTGKSRLSRQAPRSKIFRFTRILIYGITSAVPYPLRDVSRSSRYVECGMRWTLRRQAGSSRRTKTPQRTAKSCGPGAATVASSWRAYPAGDGGKKRRSPGRARISRNTIARGKPGCLGCTCSLTRVLFCATRRTRYCGCIQRPAFPAPSRRREGQRISKTRAQPSCENEVVCLSPYSLVIARLDRATQYSRDGCD
jgi:hypothetical protein